MLDSGVQFAENMDTAREGGTVARTTVPSSTELAVNVPDAQSIRQISVRTRFEIFKRDDFTCRYCGRKTPEVVLEVDHIVPVCDGGSNDPINLATSCWECNRGKAGNPLQNVITGEDPTDRAVLMLERERQLREYDAVLAGILERRTDLAQDLLNFWCDEAVVTGVPRSHFTWLVRTLEHVPATVIKEAMLSAICADAVKDWRYVMAVVRNKREGR